MRKYLFLIPAIVLCTLVQAQTYNFYFGNIHAHSGYSDGNKDSVTSGMSTPIEDFLYAQNSQHIDFYGISEHNHHSAGMAHTANYHQGIADANAATTTDFVAMYGMEWGVINNGGHVIIYGYDSLIGWEDGYYDVFNGQYDYAALWNKINAVPNAFGYLAHPDFADYNSLFSTTAGVSADNAIVGMAARSGPAFSTNSNYSNPTSGNYIARYNDALKMGYHLGVGLDHDTHYSVFGRQTKGRLVVLAETLTRDNILDAFRNMRFYSSDDWNCKVNFAINSNVMGSVVTQAGSPTLSVTVADDDGSETSATIQVFYGVPGSGVNPTVLTTANNTTTLNYTHTIANNTEYYYYLKITQADGDIIWTSPIWYTRNDGVTNNPPTADFTPSALITCINQPVTFNDNSTNAPTAWAWSLPGATPNTSTNQNVVATYAAPGTYTAYLIASNQYGADTTLPVTITVNLPPTVTAIAPAICKGEIDTLIASGADTYTWSNGANGPVIYVSPTTSTNYTVTGYTNGCSAQYTVTVTVQNCTGVEEEVVPTFTLYPNPANGFVSVDATAMQGIKLIEVYDLTGRKVLTKISPNNIVTLDITALNSGHYVVKTTMKNNNAVSHQQLIIQH